MSLTLRGVSFWKKDDFWVLKSNCERHTCSSFSEAWREEPREDTEATSPRGNLEGGNSVETHKGSVQLEGCILGRHVKVRQRWSDTNRVIVRLETRKKQTDRKKKTSVNVWTV